MRNSEAIPLRPMTERDLSAGVELCRLVGWNQRIGDWRLFFGANPAGCFVAESRGSVVGTVTTTNYEERVGWIAMMLVHPEYRRRGLGSALMRRAIEALDACGCIKLDATPEGRRVYVKLGFADEYVLTRMTRRAGNGQVIGEDGPETTRMDSDDMEEVVAFDQARFGVVRRSVLEALFHLAPDCAFVLRANGGLRGFCLGRHGQHFTQLGPVEAGDEATARALVSAAMARHDGRSLCVDVADALESWRRWLGGQGFVMQRPFIRMYRGANLDEPGKEQVYAIAGPELG